MAIATVALLLVALATSANARKDDVTTAVLKTPLPLATNLSPAVGLLRRLFFPLTFVSCCILRGLNVDCTIPCRLIAQRTSQSPSWALMSPQTAHISPGN